MPDGAFSKNPGEKGWGRGKEMWEEKAGKLRKGEKGRHREKSMPALIVSLIREKGGGGDRRARFSRASREGRGASAGRVPSRTSKEATNQGEKQPKTTKKKKKKGGEKRKIKIRIEGRRVPKHLLFTGKKGRHHREDRDNGGA